jgi:hypothetical protein
MVEASSNTRMPLSARLAAPAKSPKAGARPVSNAGTAFARSGTWESDQGPGVRSTPSRFSADKVVVVDEEVLEDEVVEGTLVVVGALWVEVVVNSPVVVVWSPVEVVSRTATVVSLAAPVILASVVAVVIVWLDAGVCGVGETTALACSSFSSSVNALSKYVRPAYNCSPLSTPSSKLPVPIIIGPVTARIVLQASPIALLKLENLLDGLFKVFHAVASVLSCVVAFFTALENAASETEGSSISGSRLSYAEDILRAMASDLVK